MSILSRSWQRTLGRETLIPPVSAEQLSRGLFSRVLLMRSHVRLAIIALAALSALFGLVGPYCQKLFVDKILAGEGQVLPQKELFLLIFLAFLALLFSQIFGVVCKLVCSREGALTNQWLSRALYSHGLELSQASRRSRPTGEFVNVFSQDVSAVSMLLDELLPVAVMSLIPFFAAPFAVWLYFSISIWPLLLVSGASLLLLFFLAWRQAGFFSAFKRLATERLAVVNEWLQNIRIIRILGWTESFEEKIFDKRRIETENRLQMVTNGSAMSAFSQVAPGLMSITGITTVVLSQRSVTPGEIFALLWVLSVFLSRPIRSLPFNMVMLLDGLTSSRRLEAIFALEREDALKRVASRKDYQEGYSLEVKGLHLEMDGKTLISSVDLSLKEGEFLAIVGEVGAGKSLLLDSLLRETPAHFALYRIHGQNALDLSLEILRGNFAYVPQEGFIMSSSLRDNVAFTYKAKTDDSEIQRSLQLAAFTLDKAMMKDGLDTEIGERGVNLSGGQRQRVSLARAHASRRSIILLDDCLSAVDVDTERLLLSELIEGEWRDKTRVLVTHRLSVLPRADRILVMQEGQFILEGTYEGLMKTSEIFRELTQTLAKEEGE